MFWVDSKSLCHPISPAKMTSETMDVQEVCPANAVTFAIKEAADSVAAAVESIAEHFEESYR